MVSTSLVPSGTDVLVIGGGPAGLAVAIAARQMGLDVVLADRAQPPIDKACGEGLMPDALAALRQIGVDLGSAQCSPFRGIRFLDDKLEAEASFPPGSFGLGVRRTELHRILVERAQEAGVVALWGRQIEGLDPTGAIVGGRTICSRWIVGADGFHSRVRQWAGLAPPAWNGARRIGLRQHYRIRPWTDFVEVYWRKDCQAYVTPVGSGRGVCCGGQHQGEQGLRSGRHVSGACKSSGWCRDNQAQLAARSRCPPGCDRSSAGASPWWVMRLDQSMLLLAKDLAWRFDRQIALQGLSPQETSRGTTQAIGGWDGCRG